MLPERGRTSRILIAADKSTSGLRETLASSINKKDGIEVIGLSRTKISRVRQEIRPQKPDVVLVTADLYNPVDDQELMGFIRKVRKHCPTTRIVIQTRKLRPDKLEQFCEAGANAWIDEQLDHIVEGQVLSDVAHHRHTPISNLVKPDSIVFFDGHN